MLTVEVDNRSGVEVDEGAAVELAAPRAARRGDRRRRARARVRRRRRRCAALKREHLGIDEATDVLSFPIDGRDELPEGLPRALGDVVLCPAGRRRGVARAAHPRAAPPARLRPRRAEMERRERGAPAVRRASERGVGAEHAGSRLVQLRVRGDHPRAAHAAEHADPLRDRGARARRSRSPPT